MALTGQPTDFSPSMIKNLSLDKYIDLASYLNEVNKPDNRAALVKTYGSQGITGFLQMVGAVKAQAVADEVTYWEEARLHQLQSGTFVQATGELTAASADAVYVRVNDIMLMDGEVRVFVTDVTGAVITVVSLDGTALPADGSYDCPVVGNLFAQGSDQNVGHFESNVVKRTNPFMIMKEVYKVTGSQATNIGWIDLGNGDYR